MTRSALGGSSNSVARLGLNAIPIYYFLTFRYLGVLLIALASSRSIKDDFVTIRTTPRLRNSLAISGILSALSSLFFYLGLKALPVSVVSLLSNGFQLLFVTLIGIAFLKERHTRRFYFLFVMLFPFLFLIMFPSRTLSVSLPLAGVLWLATGAILSATETHMTRGQLKRIAVSTHVAVKTACSLLVALVCLAFGNHDVDQLVDGFSWLVAFALAFGIFNTLGIQFLQAVSIKQIGATTTTLFQPLTAVFSVLFALAIFGESLNWSQWLGVAGVLGVVFFIKDADKMPKGQPKENLVQDGAPATV